MITAAVALSLAFAAAPADAAPRPTAPSLVLIIGSNRGTRGTQPALQYADDDAAKYHEVFATIAGEENTILLTDFDRDTARLFPALLDKARSPTRAQLDVAVARLSRKAAELARAGRLVRFHFVFAGHGDVDQGRGFLELADGPFTAEDLQAMIATIGAAESHVILDSCNSFFVVNPRRPGGTRFATPREAAEALGRRLPNVGVFLSTSAKAEVYEWSELQSGVFSHAVRSGLLGAADVNRDGNVSYEELAAFVETAAADIKNPLYRPTVYARGPNGDDGRPILVVPHTPRPALTIDEAGPVRLAARDADGLRWLDLHKAAGAAVTLWFPPSVAARLELDRLAVDVPVPTIESTHALRLDENAPARLSDLPAGGPAVAMRGAGEIFQGLFRRPFGEPAFTAWVAQRRVEPDAALALTGEAAAPASAAPAARTPGDAGPEEGAMQPGFYLVLRPGVVQPWLRGTDGMRHVPSPSTGPSLMLGAGRLLNPWLAVELEGGYQRPASFSSAFGYPAVGYPGPAIPNTSYQFELAPVAINVRVQVPSASARPYLIVGGGVMFVGATMDPPDFNATYRVSRSLPFAQAGFGILADVGSRVFLGIEARAFVTTDVSFLDGTIGFHGGNASLLLGARL